ncbi:MAG: porin family protein [Verrucomicrobiota bacterium]
MNRIMPGLIRATTLSLALLAAPSVFAEQNHFYVQGDVGGSIASDVDLKAFFGEPIAANAQISLDPGARFGVRGGYGLTDWLAAEAETGLTINRIDTISTPGVADSTGSILNVPLLFNLRLQVPEKNRLAPYAGAGLGFANTILTGDDLIIGATRFSGSASDVVFAYQFFAGLRFALNETMGISAEYHYFHAEASSMSVDVISGVGSDTVKLGATESHSFTFAFDWRF